MQQFSPQVQRTLSSLGITEVSSTTSPSGFTLHRATKFGQPVSMIFQRLPKAKEQEPVKDSAK